jgi:RNA polymerase sigma factor (sigma-70 family)
VNAGKKFATTRWSVVLSAGADDALGQRALMWLCEAYWQPIFEHIRRSGYEHADAQDLAQGFFARLLEKRDLVSDPDKGRFRNYLLGALNHFLANERDRAQAQKRGGGRTHVSTSDSTEQMPLDRRSPEQAFARAWAVSVIERALSRLQQEQEAERPQQFARLKPYLAGDADAGTYSEAGVALGMTETAVKVAVHRLRKRYRDLLRAEVAETLASPTDGSEIEAELRDLLDALKA